MNIKLICLSVLIVSLVVFGSVTGCSILGDNGVESAPYTLILDDDASAIEVRNYESMILVSASMEGDSRNNAFRKLFKYITGENKGNNEIAMTAPVFMQADDDVKEGLEIAMTAPVFMDPAGSEAMMSFVMPAEFTLESTPIPNDPSVVVSEVKNYKVAAIKFAGTLSDRNVAAKTKVLKKWIQDNAYNIASEPVMAGYNGPLTLPMFRHNEVLIQVKRK
ncbi:SOUL family heme-binding protein [Glaciecola petra]|uniref:Heme-binding protein n=1 Tax=Glaciecola petra TaxID=3075602 RepID=A0ABU2ZRX0_9ALTE|nr:heme-binding protein [Aestuariibacter sp. P117]MDT0595380.1 heme-binding protein [Aestuariibacter sp. P117]